MPALKRYKIFISHSWDYRDEYYRLEQMLKSTGLFNFANHSVPNHDPLDTNTDKELSDALERQIRGCQVFIILGRMYAKNRKWVKKEIMLARKYDKPILLVIPWGQQRVPIELQQIMTDYAYWNSASIVNKIRYLTK